MPIGTTEPYAIPPITNAHLSRYATIAETAPPEIRDIMRTLLDCCKAALAVGLPDRPGASLSAEHIRKLDPTVPYRYELVAMQKELNKLPSGVAPDPSDHTKNIVSDQAAWDLKNAAFHLLVYSKGLCKDRVPRTMDADQVRMKAAQHGKWKLVTLDPT